MSNTPDKLHTSADAVPAVPARVRWKLRVPKPLRLPVPQRLRGRLRLRPRTLNPLRRLTQQEQINFLLTNRIPRHALTKLVGRVSRIHNPKLARALIGMWRLFADDLRLHESEQQSFASLQECFTRRLKPGMRPLDEREHIAVSPCDAVIGECGRIEGSRVFQAKGFPYELGELIPDPAVQQLYRDGTYVTLRLKSDMYHRFHAPVDCRTQQITYISGDTWNVNPIALKRVEKLYCRNERAVVQLHDAATGGSLCLVPVAAILVASMRFAGLHDELSLAYRGPNLIPWQRSFAKGEEMGWFQHGSTILLFATGNYALCEGIRSGDTIRMGQALLTASSV
ncbi:MAG TPA: archaetidylserine decarboxylase [Nevskiaceae bacterium]|nr:archaetidylserine decarboxylase [Nevskiaceae bacterium]